MLDGSTMRTELELAKKCVRKMGYDLQKSEGDGNFMTSDLKILACAFRDVRESENKRYKKHLIERYDALIEIDEWLAELDALNIIDEKGLCMRIKKGNYPFTPLKSRAMISFILSQLVGRISSFENFFVFSVCLCWVSLKDFGLFVWPSYLILLIFIIHISPLFSSGIR